MSAVIERKQGFSLAPKSMDEAIRFVEIVSKSTLVPREYQNNAGNCLVAIQWGAELGLAPLQSMQNIAVINGRPAVYGDAMLSLVKGSGLLEYIRETQSETEAICTVKRKGEEEVTRTFSKDEAIKASLWGKAGPWTQYPKRMLQMRARAFALRDVFPDVLKGMYIAEEAQDIPAEKDMGAVEVVPNESVPPAPAHKGGVEKLKEKLGIKNTVSLDEIKREIEGATTLEALEAAGIKARSLQNDEEKGQARWVYDQKLKELKKAKEEVVEDVVEDIPIEVEAELVEEEEVQGEAKEERPKVTQLGYVTVLNQINRAKTKNQLSIARDNIHLVEYPRLRSELTAIADEKEKTLRK